MTCSNFARTLAAVCVIATIAAIAARTEAGDARLDAQARLSESSHLPFFLRLERTRLPAFVFFLALKPWVLFLFLLFL